MPAPDSPAAIASKLTSERAKLLESLAGLEPAVLVKPYGEGGWSIKDILAHVAMAEQVNVAFAKLMVEKDLPDQLREFARLYPELGQFDLDRFNASMAERWSSKTVAEVLAALGAVRAKTLDWLLSLNDDQLERRGQHAVWGRQSVRLQPRKASAWPSAGEDLPWPSDTGRAGPATR